MRRAWAHRTLAAHCESLHGQCSTRPKQLEDAETHDALWNAAQMHMVTQGWMHNYMRMYWAKKILEWTRTPAGGATGSLSDLNDKYELDGRDPNGYAGIAWAIAASSIGRGSSAQSSALFATCRGEHRQEIRQPSIHPPESWTASCSGAR